MKDKLFKIGDFCFRLLFPEQLSFPPNFLLFSTEKGEPEVTFSIEATDQIIAKGEEVLAKRQDLLVYKTAGGEGRLIGMKGKNSNYASYEELSDDRVKIRLVIPEKGELRIDPVFVSMFALERYMIRRNSLILHCAYLEHQGKAVLFSAPSGVGKSTQASLWEKYRGSRTINGDRALLRKTDEGWIASGWPVCGSSEICHVQDAPVCGIVMLKQGNVNQVERLSGMQAFTKLYAQITINQWNPQFVRDAMELLEELIGQVPVYQLTCDRTEEAVAVLENVLFSTKGNC